ncbi:FMN-binding protein [Demequina sp. NBRC 110053]|uniref:FMN-binding protein n=1 Tax=Demequina sp. NBRC 110053 TaxID=1570342 RepID=UPI0011864B15|nr:FMN-binding protein [Demequina sp. NBRC 110053]
MRTSRALMVTGASAALLTAGVIAAPDPLADAVAAPGGDPAGSPADDDCEREIDPSSNSGRGNTEDPIEERERDDDPSGDDCDQGPAAGGQDSAAGGDQGAAPAGATTVDGPVVTNVRGDYQARLIIVDGAVVDVEFPVAGTSAAESRRVNEMALPVLEERILEAQSGDVEYVSGASYTSPAITESAQAAFAEAGL